eukprot:TRINITY_DN13454_c0_g1_i1.p1 TRINITY_DN13454_c0_g1~~TRINITY_DN13454_c0_g1_i1.p1  ORF type:complete len:133 (-),score=34.72 TRINITY_DN13454_c0_g1_i1:196-594(-)
MKLKDDLQAANVRFVAVGTGSPHFAKTFKAGSKFEGDVLLDPQGSAYNVLALPKFKLSRFLLPSAWKALAKALFRYSNNLQEDNVKLQSGGVYVMGPGEGKKMLFAWREADEAVGAVPDLAALKAAALAPSS